MNTLNINADESFKHYLKNRARSETLVILGPQGSGTNLLVKLLMECFGIKPLLDRSLIFDAAVKLPHSPTRDDIRKQYDYVLRKLKPGPLQKRLSLKHYYRISPAFEGVETQFEESKISTPGQFVDFFYSYAAFVKESLCKAIKSDDMWQNIDHAPRILQDARYILLVRDPRDNAKSMINKNFGPCHIYAASTYTKHRMAEYRNFFDKAASKEDLVIRYEDLLSDPAAFCTQFSKHYASEPVGDLENALDRAKVRGTNHSKWRSLPASHLAICE